MSSSLSRLAWACAVLSASQTALGDVWTSHDNTQTTTFQSLILNTDTTSPNAKQADGASAPTQTLDWQIFIAGYYNEDRAEQVMEFRNRLTMPILASDNITFHVEFYKGSTAPTANLLRDGFECEMSKQSSTNFWDVTVRDIYVRDDPTNDSVNDFSNTQENDGQDWYVFETDSEMSRWNSWRSSQTDRFYQAGVTSYNDSYQCRGGSDNSIVECQVLECIARRKYTTGDEFEQYDFNLAADGTQVITFPATYSYILMNQANIEVATDKNRLRSLVNLAYTIEEAPTPRRG